ncbi:hypothetical protein [Nostoc cycadae]|uniref:Uncharacterized protein n=1 Tax=Nostoc cycadae WK-1 TaxID=1861711 RepID=A0A2H6LBT4_9NOSO|nr:hypothetical protein [Nostoc cycadae]GBE90652.1 hypothetical protein NCWK1_0371 [Nostoc cycadae WK-1]
MMDFKSFSELREFIRRYNSISVLEIGTQKCWQKWETQYSDHIDRSHSNTERNYAVRLMLIASAGNPHRREKISVQTFDNLIYTYHNWGGHTISDQRILEEEVNIILSSILDWENKNEKQVRNWTLRLSSILNKEVIRTHIAGLFIQRLGAFQNAGFGYPLSRIHRTIKLIELLDRRSNQQFSNDFFNHIGLIPTNYFRQFLACLSLFGFFAKIKGFLDFSQLPVMEDELEQLGINSENLKVFVKQNSTLFSSKADTSFRSKINKTLKSVPDFYQPLFYNYLLEIPFIELNNEKFCLPDPFSFTESCWNQIKSIVVNHNRSRAFEDYLENVLFPFICPKYFEKIPEVKNSISCKDKRADFLITTQNSYIVVECKSSVMSSDTSAYFQADKLADLWCRIHSALEQIAITVEALNLKDKPVIPLIMTFYDSIAASTVFGEMVKQTDYCSLMGLNIPPVVYSLHEFEHWISDRSLNNWSESILAKQNALSPVLPDNKGHNYEHLNDIHIL